MLEKQIAGEYFGIIKELIKGGEYWIMFALMI